ncbi:hypothetical protein KHM83_16780 [Fusibacter paucivorans]|uniref:Uncharacterized protein n=1 Tax=Fusibacter paucivorans TaxID=76009 RepID=A0ABS5PUU0_9FIRM|nr:hypothetical protein [Fusibacter paucivorans]MBS7528346.1 hypothetical protein [Fusibacter paucivorans]
MKKFEIKWKPLPKLAPFKRIVLYIFTILMSALSLIDVIYGVFPEIAAYVVYTIAGIGLALACYYITLDIKYLIHFIMKPRIKRNRITNQFVEDKRFRVITLTRTSFGMNLLYALFNGFYGIYYRSEWFGSLAFYYCVLSMMRFLVVRVERSMPREDLTEDDKKKVRSIYWQCGFLLALITFILGWEVIQLSLHDVEKTYPGMLIYAIAAYTFYKLTIASINMAKVKRTQFPLLKAIRYIGYADALVSVLSLQIAMFTHFSVGAKTMTSIFNVATGTVVCFMILTLSMLMMRINNSET